MELEEEEEERSCSPVKTPVGGEPPSTAMTLF
jgi:hypothetical protein